MKPLSDFTPFVTNFDENKEQYFEKVSQVIKREPSLFYLITASENNSKLKSTICFTISAMLEN